MKPYYETELGRLYHGNSNLLITQFEPADLICTSPPYAKQRDYEKLTGRWDWNFNIVNIFKILPYNIQTQILINLGLIYKNGNCNQYWQPLIEIMKKRGFNLYGWYIWDQLSGLPGDWHGRLAPSHEFIFHFNKNHRNLNKIKYCKHFGRSNKGSTALRRKNNKTYKYSHNDKSVQKFKIPDSVFRINREYKRKIDFPAPYPVELVIEIIATFSNELELVIDPLIGSGTTAIACERLNRHWIGIEIEEKYCEIAAKRIENERKQLKLF